MTGLIGALVALAVVLVIVLVLAVRPPARRAARALADLTADVAVQRERLRALRRARSSVPPASAAAPSLIGGRGRHRRQPDRP